MAILASLAALAGDAHAQTWHSDLSTTILIEAWDRNEGREQLAGAAAGVDRRVWRSVAVRAEALALRVWQAGPDAWAGGVLVGPRLRWMAPSPRPYVDVAVGWASASVPVPPRGTRGNYLAAIGSGVELPAGSVRLNLGVRWLHLSNNGREGRHRNPDIQSLGVVFGVGWEN